MQIKVLKEKLITVNTFKTQNFTDRILRLWIPNVLYMKNSFYTVNKLEIIKKTSLIFGLLNKKIFKIDQYKARHFKYNCACLSSPPPFLYSQILTLINFLIQ